MDTRVGPDERVSIAIVRAVSEAEGVRPDDLPPLHDAVDPEALNRLFGPPDDGRATLFGSLSFTYSGSVVTIEDSTRIHVEDKSESSLPS